MLVVESDGLRWVFPVDEVDQVYRFPPEELTGAPATLARSAGRLTRAVLAPLTLPSPLLGGEGRVKGRERSIGYLDDERLFRVLRARIQ